MHVHEAQQVAHGLHNRICASKNQTWSPFVALADAHEEAGEAADVAKNLEGYAPHQEPATPERLASEPSDLMWSVFVLAGMYGLDLEAAFTRTLESYGARFLK